MPFESANAGLILAGWGEGPCFQCHWSLGTPALPLNLSGTGRCHFQQDWEWNGGSVPTQLCSEQGIAVTLSVSGEGLSLWVMECPGQGLPNNPGAGAFHLQPSALNLKRNSQKSWCRLKVTLSWQELLVWESQGCVQAMKSQVTTAADISTDKYRHLLYKKGHSGHWFFREMFSLISNRKFWSQILYKMAFWYY